LQEMFRNASKQASTPEPQPSTSGTHVSAVLSLPHNPDLTYSEETLLMSTYSTSLWRQNNFCCCCCDF